MTTVTTVECCQKGVFEIAPLLFCLHRENHEFHIIAYILRDAGFDFLLTLNIHAASVFQSIGARCELEIPLFKERVIGQQAASDVLAKNASILVRPEQMLVQSFRKPVFASVRSDANNAVCAVGSFPFSKTR